MLVEGSADGTLTGLRNRAHLTVLYRTGARCDESCNMNLADIYPVDGGCAVIRIRKPKGYNRGAMPREVGIDKRAASYIYDWIAERGRKPGPLFLSKNGLRLHPSYLRQLLPRLALKLHLERRVHAHAFRHTFAYRLINYHNVPVRVLQAHYSHVSIAMTLEQANSLKVGTTFKVFVKSGRN